MKCQLIIMSLAREYGRAPWAAIESFFEALRMGVTEYHQAKSTEGGAYEIL